MPRFQRGRTLDSHFCTFTIRVLVLELLLAVKEEPVQLVRRRICDTLAEVALHVMAQISLGGNSGSPYMV